MLEDSKLGYGNPNQYDLHLLKQETYLDSIQSELIDFFPPDNDSQETDAELQQIIQGVNSIVENEELVRRYSIYDAKLTEYISNVLVAQMPNEKVNIKALIVDILNDINPLLAKLKFKVQRPRPYQLAYTKKLFLYPIPTLFSSTPSFPSGHAYQSKIICEVLGNLYPKFHAQLTHLYNDISYSRLYMGVHYDSDIKAGLFLAEKVLLNKEFKTKYKI